MHEVVPSPIIAHSGDKVLSWTFHILAHGLHRVVLDYELLRDRDPEEDAVPARTVVDDGEVVALGIDGSSEWLPRPALTVIQALVVWNI